MNDFKILVNYYLLSKILPGIFAVGIVVLTIILITVFITAKELKKQRGESNAEQFADYDGEMPAVDDID